MKAIRWSVWCTGVGALALFGLVLAVPAQADAKFHSFQFTDEYYLENGIDVTKAVDHFVFPDAKEGFDRTRLDTPPDERYNDVRVIENTGGYNHSGGLLYYIAPSKVMPRTFTSDGAGDTQRATCNEYRAFLFPKVGSETPLSPAPPNRRQDNIFETDNGYFSNNPLGCWRLTFVTWDGSNLGGEQCEKHRLDLLEKNGETLNAGVPIIKDKSTINKLAADGCVNLRQRREGGDDGFPWVI